MTDDALSGLVRISRFLSYVLRHRPDAIGIRLDDGGWVDIDELLAALTRAGRPLDRATLERVAAGTDKRRLEIRGDRVRAAQGHTVPVDLGLAPVEPPAVLYHGTVAGSLPGIRAEGIEPRGRTHVHLSTDVPTATSVGARRGDPVVLAIDAEGMHRLGHEFFLAANGVWLTDHVPPEFIRPIP